MVEYQSLDHELGTKGYLSLTKAVKWLKEKYPKAAVSYPTALNLVREGKLRSTQVGNMHRISSDELHRFGAHGNWDEEQELSAQIPVNVPLTNNTAEQSSSNVIQLNKRSENAQDVES